MIHGDSNGGDGREGVSVVLSSHLLAELERVTDHLVLMCGGRVCLDGPVDDLLAAHRLVTTRSGPAARNPMEPSSSRVSPAPRPTSSSGSIRPSPSRLPATTRGRSGSRSSRWPTSAPARTLPPSSKAHSDDRACLLARPGDQSGSAASAGLGGLAPQPRGGARPARPRGRTGHVPGDHRSADARGVRDLGAASHRSPATRAGSSGTSFVNSHGSRDLWARCWWCCPASWAPSWELR